MTDLSIIIVSFNTMELTKQTITSLEKSLKLSPHLTSEVIVVDNASVDDSVDMLKKQNVTLIQNKKNLGFGAANNIGIKKARGKYILLLNSDVIADNIDFASLIKYMKNDPSIGALTVRLELQKGGIDPASHRGFPTLWRSFTYYSKLEEVLGYIPILDRFFGGYHLTHQQLTKTHEIDSPTGAFYFTRKDILDEVKGFDEKFFMYGEDLDLSYRIKQKGYKIVYHPVATAIHLKHQSGLKHAESDTQKQTNHHFYDAMRIFYDKHYAKNNPKLVNSIVHLAITFKSRV